MTRGWWSRKNPKWELYIQKEEPKRMFEKADKDLCWGVMLVGDRALVNREEFRVLAYPGLTVPIEVDSSLLLGVHYTPMTKLPLYVKKLTLEEALEKAEKGQFSKVLCRLYKDVLQYPDARDEMEARKLAYTWRQENYTSI